MNYAVIFYDKDEEEIDSFSIEAFTPEEAFKIADKEFSEKYGIESSDEISYSYEVR